LLLNSSQGLSAGSARRRLSKAQGFWMGIEETSFYPPYIRAKLFNASVKGQGRVLYIWFYWSL
jgi:hypothetical protein